MLAYYDTNRHPRRHPYLHIVDSKLPCSLPIFIVCNLQYILHLLFGWLHSIVDVFEQVSQLAFVEEPVVGFVVFGKQLCNNIGKVGRLQTDSRYG